MTPEGKMTGHKIRPGKDQNLYLAVRNHTKSENTKTENVSLNAY